MLENMRLKEIEKKEAEEAKKMKQLEREQKKKEREKKRREEDKAKAMGKRTRENEAVEDLLAGIQLSDDIAKESSEEDAICPNCGLMYSADDGIWICCDGCDSWYDLKCTNIRGRNISDTFYCENCLFHLTNRCCIIFGTLSHNTIIH